MSMQDPSTTENLSEHEEEAAAIAAETNDDREDRLYREFLDRKYSALLRGQ